MGGSALELLKCPEKLPELRDRATLGQHSSPARLWKLWTWWGPWPPPARPRLWTLCTLRLSCLLLIWEIINSPRHERRLSCPSRGWTRMWCPTGFLVALDFGAFAAPPLPGPLRAMPARI